MTTAETPHACQCQGSSLAPGALSPRDAARYMGLSEKTIWSLTKTGKLPACKVGRRVIYRRETLDRFLSDVESSIGGVRV
jgi:excisionase family DNA binding protein